MNLEKPSMEFEAVCILISIVNVLLPKIFSGIQCGEDRRLPTGIKALVHTWYAVRVSQSYFF